jgi:uncharacterized LabA/DUF88 family protein
MTFVNGSHLFGAFKHLDVYVNDYEALYRHLFEQTVARWHGTFSTQQGPVAQHVRAYWYVVDSMDEWDLSNPRTRQYLFERFQEDREVKTRWVAEAARLHHAPDQFKLEQIAFNMCFDDFKGWYDKRVQILGGMNRFHHALEISSDFIEICRCGRWKLDLLRKTVTEKGLDVCFAVDLVGLRDSYDVALLVTGEADGVFGMDYVKNQGKQVAVIEFQRNGMAETRGRSLAPQLKLDADFIVPVTDADLLRAGIATREEAGGFTYREEAEAA